MYLKYFPTAVALLRSCGAEAMMRLCPESLQAWAWGATSSPRDIPDTSIRTQPPPATTSFFFGSIQTDQSGKSCFFPLIPADFIVDLDCACLPWAPTMFSLWGHSLELLLLLLLTLRNFPMQRNLKKRVLNPCCVLFIGLRSSQVCAFPCSASRQPSHNCCSTSSFSKGPQIADLFQKMGFFSDKPGF